jgi:hypothetical protein
MKKTTSSTTSASATNTAPSLKTKPQFAMMRAFALASACAIALAACSKPPTNTQPPALTQAEMEMIGNALIDEWQNDITGLSLADTMSMAAAANNQSSIDAQAQATLPSCVSVSSTTDSDNDGVPDNATYTFNCSKQNPGGAGASVTGAQNVQDKAENIFKTITNLKISVKTPNNNRSATRNGTQTLLTSSADGDIELQLNTTTDLVNNNENSKLTNGGTIKFNAANGAPIDPTKPLPDGIITIDDKATLTSGSNSYSILVRAQKPLYYTANCADTLKITDGKLTLTITKNGSANVVSITFTGCGNTPIIVP